MTQSPQPVSSSLFLVFVGIDVAKDKLDLARSDSGELLTVEQRPARHRQARRICSPPANRSASSSKPPADWNASLLEALLEANLPVALVNPGRVRHFAIGMSILAKTDRHRRPGAHASSLQLAQPRLAQKRSENQAELDALVTCRRQLARAEPIQHNSRLTTTSPNAIRSHRRRPQDAGQADRGAGQQDPPHSSIPTMTSSISIACSARCPASGRCSSATLLAELVSWATPTAAKSASLVGVAPFNRDSGKLQRQTLHPRRTHSGALRPLHGHPRRHALQSDSASPFASPQQRQKGNRTKSSSSPA